MSTTAPRKMTRKAQLRKAREQPSTDQEMKLTQHPPAVTTVALDPDGWKPFASFVVELQTRPTTGQSAPRRTKVHHIEADTCAQWSGIASEQLCRWMMQQLEGMVG